MSGHNLHLPAGTAGNVTFDVVVTPDTAGWGHSGLRVLTLPAGGAHTIDTGPDEVLVVPLAGSCRVQVGEQTHELAGRGSVFHGPSDFAYVGRRSIAAVDSDAGGRFALCSARAGSDLPFRYGPAADVPVELRGAGQCSRQVHNFGTVGVFEAAAIIACEVITPGGNWSSYPPHKHDRTSAEESQLEEIYYFEIADGPAGPGFGYHRGYGTAERPLDLLVQVGTGDVVLVPHGWHGPSIAAPGYAMYYLNVMAGPGAERAWRIVDDPSHAWIRDTWAGQDVDARLPVPERTTP